MEPEVSILMYYCNSLLTEKKTHRGGDKTTKALRALRNT